MVTDSGEKIEYENLINTTPLNVFLKQFDDEEAKSTLQEMSYNKVLVLNIGFDRPSEKYEGIHWVYYPDKNLNFYRIGFTTIFSAQKS